MFLPTLIGLIFLLLAIAAVGHGIWVLLAKLFGGWTAEAPHPGPRRTAFSHCPRCFKANAPYARWCLACGLRLDGETAAELRDLEATVRQLERFEEAGLLSQVAAGQLRSVVQIRRQRLGPKKPVVEAPPQPGPMPAAPVEARRGPPAEAEIPVTVVQQPVASTTAPLAAVEPVLFAEVIDAAPGPAAPRERAAIEPPRVPVAPVRPPAPPPRPTAPPRPPRRTLGEVLAAFMEERNILWGEVVGGLLIVGCSIALVISLWKTLEEIPYFPFLIVAGITTALFGAGLYTLHHWKLASTSRGLLVIGTLLVPLNFWVMAGLVRPGTDDPTALLINGGTVVVFAWLLSQAARVLAPAGRWWLPVAVLGESVSQLLVPHLVDAAASAPGWFILMGGLPVVFFGLGVGGVARTISRRGLMEAAHAQALFAFLGMAAFALLAAVGFLLFVVVQTDAGNVRTALHYLAVQIALAGIPVLIAGILVHRGLERTDADEDDNAGPAPAPAAALLPGESVLSPRATRAALRTGGTAVLLVGMMVMLAGVILAWPQPEALLLVCALNFGVLTVVAFRHDLPGVHAGALLCLAIGYAVGGSWLGGQLAEVPEPLLGLRLLEDTATGFGAIRLVFLAGLLAGAAEVCARRGRREHAAYYAAGSGSVALVSWLLVTGNGLEAPERPALVSAIYAAGSLAVNRRWRRSLVSYFGLGLGVAALGWTLEWQWPVFGAGGAVLEAAAWSQNLAVWGAAAGLAGLALAGWAALLMGWRGLARPVAESAAPRYLGCPLAQVSEVVSGLAVLAGIWSGWLLPWQVWHIATGFCLLVQYVILTGLQPRLRLARLAGWLLIGTVIAGAGWAGVRGGASDLVGLVGLCVAVASTAMACVSVWATRTRQAGEPSAVLVPAGPSCFAVLAAAWRETSAMAAIMGFTLALTTPQISSALLTATLAVLAATAFLLAWRYRTQMLTLAGSALAAGSLMHGFFWNSPGLEWPDRIALALLSHASLGMLAIVGLRRAAREPSSWVGRIYFGPLLLGAMISLVLAVPWLLNVSRTRMGLLAGWAAWWAALCLATACVRRSRVWWAACQAGLAATVVYATTAWLVGQPWLANNYPEGLTDPRSMHSYGLALALLSLGWLGVRLALRRQPAAHALLEPGRPAIDSVTLGMVVVGQLVVAVWGIMPGILRELMPRTMALAEDAWPDTYAHAYGGRAWELLGLLLVALAGAWWERRRGWALLGLAVLGLSVPVLVAGRFEESLATASALRWGLAIAFVAASMLLGMRRLLARLTSRQGMTGKAPPNLVGGVRWLLIGAALLPVLALTTAGALVRFAGEQMTGPLADSFFARLAEPWSMIIPLILLAFGLVGQALRQRSSGLAFAAGLLAELALMLGYALAAVNAAGELSPVQWVRLLQWGAVGAAAWALLWLLGRRHVSAWRPARRRPLAQPLMMVQVGLGVAANAGLLLAALAELLLVFPSLRVQSPGPAYFQASAWVLEIGSPLGWLALGLAVAAAALRHYPRRLGLPAHAVGLVWLAALALLACTLETAGAGKGYRIFMMGCGTSAFALSLGAWHLDRRRWSGADSSPLALATLWVRVAGCLVLVLGLKAAIWHHDTLWAAGAIALVSLSGAAIGVWQRREDWAFTSGLGLNLAVSLGIWHLHHQLSVERWWVLLVQANIMANAAGTLFWLWTRRRAAATPDRTLPSGHLLDVQVALGVVASLVLLIVPVVHIVLAPAAAAAGGAGWEDLRLSMFGDVWGWLALVLVATAAGAYVREAGRWSAWHLAGGLGLAIGVLVACTLSRWDAGDWLTYHTLTASWTIVATAMLAAGWTAAQRQSNPPADALAQAWVAGIAGAVLGLAWRGAWDDPGQPYWSAAAILAVSALTGALALWSKLSWYVYASGILVNLAGITVWLAWGPATPGSWVCTNVLCLGLTAIGWGLLEMTRGLRSRFRQIDHYYLPYSHLAALVGLSALCLVVGHGVMANLQTASLAQADALAWAAWASIVAALAVSSWDTEARFTWVGLYAAGLAGCGLALDACRLTPTAYLWTLALVLAGYVLLTSFLSARLSEKGSDPLRPKGSDPFSDRRARPLPWAESWFLPAQALAGFLVLVISWWMAIDFDQVGDRLAGPLSVAGLIAAGILLAQGTPSRWSKELRAVTLLLVPAALIEGSWALLDPTIAAPWLHREMLVMVIFAVMPFVYGAGLARLLPRAEGWTASARALAPTLGLLACGMMAVVLVHEFSLYDSATKTTPFTWPGVVIVGIALATLIVTGLYFAIVPGADLLGLPERRRTWYVYGCEAVLVVLFVHLRLNVPGLFGVFGAKYWTLIIMAIAFLGVGLSEYFTRKGLEVLAEPLRRTGVFLPLLPLLAFWFQPPPEVRDFARDNLPALKPMLDSVKRPAGGFLNYSVLWFLVGALYGLVAVTKQSFRFALLAALAINVGLWSLLYHYGWRFLVHPQMWLIPLALIALAAEHVNRHRLSRTQSAGLRYLALGMLYLSSTADMFITGVGNSLVLPLVLAVLAVLGVLAGILLRVRAFLFLGVAFLFLVIFAEIWHAAVDRTQTWVWWASGIVLGVGIVALFAVFEKRRQDVLRLIEEIKKWD